MSEFQQLSKERGHDRLTTLLLDAGLIVNDLDAGVIPADPKKNGCDLYTFASDYIEELELKLRGKS